MTIAQIIARIERLASIDSDMAQREADIALRSAATLRTRQRIEEACERLGLVAEIQYL